MHQQQHCISSIIASAHQQHQHLSIILAEWVTWTGRDICPYTSLNSDYISLYTLTPRDTTRHASDTTRHHQTCSRHHQTPPDMHQTMSDRLAVVLWWFIELYSWSRFFLPTSKQADERTKVFQEVLADLKKSLIVASGSIHRQIWNQIDSKRYWVWEVVRYMQCMSENRSTDCLDCWVGTA